jgi:copper chaperone
MKQRKIFIAVLGTLLLALGVVVPVNSTTVQRSSFLVENLTCISCLATIEEELRTVPGTLGMDADLSSGRVTVDHLSTLDYGQIAARINKLGYPATLDWTATVPQQYTKNFSKQNGISSTCTSGGCGVSGGTGTGPTAWKDAPVDSTVSRTTLQVGNLSCSSCLANIAAELRNMPETYGMKGYLSRGIVIVDHSAGLDNSTIAAAISRLGYPARILALNEVPTQKAYCTNSGAGTASSSVRSGFSCNSNGACNATAASWKKLYNRYFSQKDLK